MSSSFSKITSRFETNRFALILLKYNYKVKQNDILAGTVVGLESDYALVDIGLKKLAFLPLREIYNFEFHSPRQILRTNFLGEFLILSINKEATKIIVSLRQVGYIRLWEQIKQMDFRNSIIYAKIKRNLRRGKLLSFDTLDFFILNSHIPKYYRRKKFKNSFLPFKFIEVRDIKHTVSLHCKLAVFRKLTNSLEIGHTYLSTVSSLKDFGIFININGVQCLLHISEISKKRIKNIKELHIRGDQITVKIIYKDSDKGKILTSIKQLKANPHQQ